MQMGRGLLGKPKLSHIVGANKSTYPNEAHGWDRTRKPGLDQVWPRKAKNDVRSKFVDQYTARINDAILGSRRHVQISLRTKPYIYIIKDKRYRRAISQLRCNCHMSHRKKRRLTRSRTSLNQHIQTKHMVEIGHGSRGLTKCDPAKQRMMCDRSLSINTLHV